MTKEPKKTGAIRKEDGAKAPDPPETPETPETPEVDPKEAEKKEKAAKAARDRRAKEKKEKEEKEAAEALAAERRGAYIKPGLAITSNKGILAGAPKGGEVWEGDKVEPKHFNADTYKRLVEKGAIVEVK